MEEFDRPFFKKLAPNDTGAAKGKQAGVVIPKSLADYFPILETPSVHNPAPDIRLRAALFVETEAIGVESVRYQYQSWSGTRLERRLTDNLAALRSVAKGDDILVMERSLKDPLFYRLTLYRAGTSDYAAINLAVGDRRWGPLDEKDVPVPEAAVEVAEQEQAKRELSPLELFDNDAVLKETRVKRVARDRAFSRRVLPLYDYRCAVCRQGHVGDTVWEVEAAHIVPRGLKGADDARNGLALCRSHHWAFDHGLFGIGGDRRIVIHPIAAADPRNEHLVPFGGKEIADPSTASLKPDLAALAWHMENIVKL